MVINVLGAGSWGTALSILLARNGHEITLCGQNAEDLEAMRSSRENFHYLPGFVLPEGVTIAISSSELPECDFWVMATPSQGIQWGLKQIGQEVPKIVLASKGLDVVETRLLSDTCLERKPAATIAAVSGPNLAIEVVRGIPTAGVVASRDIGFSEQVRGCLNCSTYRAYSTDDLVGVELAGALKNVLAIAAGASDGLGFGDNTKGALLARGLGEMCALGVALGGRMETFMGVAGVGDLFATAASKLSRNYRVGYALGQGSTLQEALKQVEQVAEGVPTAEAAVCLARKHGVSMPIYEAVESVLRGRIAPREAVGLLMERMGRQTSDHAGSN